MPPTPYEKAKSGWPSAWLTWILTVQQKIKMIALIFFKVRRKMKHEKTHPTDAVTQTYPGLSTYVPIVKPASRAQLEMERCRWQAIVANNFASGMVA